MRGFGMTPWTNIDLQCPDCSAVATLTVSFPDGVLPVPAAVRHVRDGRHALDSTGMPNGTLCYFGQEIDDFLGKDEPEPELYPEGVLVRGRFQPRRTDDLRSEVKGMIGQVIYCRSDGRINALLSEMDGSPYGGEYYFCPIGRDYQSGHDWWWIPSGDFQDIEVVAVDE